MAGNPADLALIRMQSDGLKPLSERANYKGVFDALSRIARTEGVGALWSGAAPTVVRAMALNFGQLAFFSEAKVRLQNIEGMGPRGKTLAGELFCSFVCGLLGVLDDGGGGGGGGDVRWMLMLLLLMRFLHFLWFVLR